MNTKRTTFHVKSTTTDGPEGVVEMVVSVFGNVDHANDRVMPGAFTNSLARWKASGDPIPFIWSHQWDRPESHIGKVLEAKETGEGLLVKAQVDLDRPFAEHVFNLLKERRVREASFAYDVVKERKASDGVNELVELDLIEVGPTLKGMNPSTQLVSAKSTPRGSDAKALTTALAGRQVDAATIAGLSPTGMLLLSEILELEPGR